MMVWLFNRKKEKKIKIKTFPNEVPLSKIPLQIKEHASMVKSIKKEIEKYEKNIRKAKRMFPNRWDEYAERDIIKLEKEREYLKDWKSDLNKLKKVV